MIPGPEARTADLHLATGEFIQHEETQQHISEADIAKFEKRIGDDVRSIPRPDGSLQEQVRWHHDMARLLLQRDGYHHTMAFVRARNSTLRTITIDFYNHRRPYRVRWLHPGGRCQQRPWDHT